MYKSILNMHSMQAYTLYQSITSLPKWDGLNSAQRAVGILSCVEGTLRNIYDLVQTYKDMRNFLHDSIDLHISCVIWSNAFARKVKMDDEVNPEPVLNEKSVVRVPSINEASGIDPRFQRRA